MADVTQSQVISRARYFDRNGNPLTAGKVYAYELGTTIPKATFADAQGLVANTQPIILDSAGQANIFGGGFYTLHVFDKNNVQVDSIDGALGINYSNLSTLTGLAENTGSSLIGFIHNSSGAIKRNLLDKARDALSATDYGCVPNTGADMSAAYLSACNAALTLNLGLELLPGTYTFNTPVTQPVGVHVFCKQIPHMWRGVRKSGAFFYFNHTGRGITIANQVDNISSFTNIGTFRNQPTPGSGWNFAANDWDFYLSSCSDVRFYNCHFHNPTKGIIQTLDPSSNTSGRLIIKGLQGQFLHIGLQVDASYDTNRIEDVHNWPFWSEDPYVQSRQMATTELFILGRCDNPFFEKIFSIWHKYGFHITTYAGAYGQPGGTTSKLKLTTADLDVGACAYFVDETVNGHTGQVTGFSAQGVGPSDPLAIRLPLIFVEGSNCQLTFSNIQLDRAGWNSVRVDNSLGNDIDITDAYISRSNTIYEIDGQTLYPVFESVGGAGTIRINGKLAIASTFGNAATFPATNPGQYISPLWREYIPTITSSTGSITSNILEADFLLSDTQVIVNVLFTVTGLTSAAGELRVTMPVNPSRTSAAVGRNITNGKICSANVGAGDRFIHITDANGSFPVTAVGQIFAISVSAFY